MVQFPTEAQIFLSAAKFRLNLGPTQTPIKWIFTAPPPWVKWQWHEVDHSLLFHIKVRNVWNNTSTHSPIHFP
jgi:hypothetical protein